MAYTKGQKNLADMAVKYLASEAVKAGGDYAFFPNDLANHFGVSMSQMRVALKIIRRLKLDTPHGYRLNHPEMRGGKPGLRWRFSDDRNASLEPLARKIAIRDANTVDIVDDLEWVASDLDKIRDIEQRLEAKQQLEEEQAAQAARESVRAKFTDTRKLLADIVAGKLDLSTLDLSKIDPDAGK